MAPQRLLNGAALALVTLAGCEPTLDVGEWSLPVTDPPPLSCAEGTAAGGAASMKAPVESPWATGFEQSFCDYAAPGGFCYKNAQGTYATVTSPVHSGQYAAAFTVQSDAPGESQARCVRQGVLPVSAYYGVWYYVPELAKNTANWNLVHFQGGTLGPSPGLWDVSLRSTASGDLELYLFDFLNSRKLFAQNPVPVPIGSWFHVQVYLKRAADATGEIALYQDGQQLLDLTNLITDDTNSGQWYVGNLATGLTPPASTLYLDDVTITQSL
jgi:Polysaccharide lyase